jgi:hypothetical protein
MITFVVISPVSLGSRRTCARSLRRVFPTLLRFLLLPCQVWHSSPSGLSGVAVLGDEYKSSDVSYGRGFDFDLDDEE